MRSIVALRAIEVQTKRLEDYRGICPPEVLNQIGELALGLRGKKIGNLNATANGGGVAEILSRLVPLMHGIGLQVEWDVIEAAPSFFEITKKIHNLLQGGEHQLTKAEEEEYLQTNQQLAEEMARKNMDIWLVHDPQPLAVSASLNSQNCKMWRCHINTTSPSHTTLEFLLPYMKKYHRSVFTLADYVPPGLETDRVAIIPPAIDPLSEKNRELSIGEASAILQRLGMDTSRPVATQVSRFDRWKDPIGVVDAYRKAKGQVPSLQLALVGAFSATDDPEAPRVYAEVEAHRANDPDIHLFKDPQLIGDREVNAFQTGSTVIMQKSIREGFGLTVTEAMWKSKPVIGGNTGGIRAQIDDGINGFLVDNVGQAAARLVELLDRPELRERMGKAAKESVRRRFLLPRLLLDHLRLFASCQ